MRHVGFWFVLTLLCASAFGATPLKAMAAKKGHARAHHGASGCAVAPTGTLHESDLLCLAKVAIGKPTDQFSNDPTNAFSGRRFIYSQPVHDGADDSGVDSYWTYDKNNSAISFTVRPATYGEVSILYHRTLKGTFIGQTAMGVKFRIAKYDGLDIHISPDYEGPIKINGTDDVMSVTKLANPNEGRELSRDVVLLIEGTLSKSGDSVASCSSEDMNASLDDPTEEIRLTCVINAKIDHLAFVKLSDGSVIKEMDLRTQSKP